MVELKWCMQCDAGDVPAHAALACASSSAFSPSKEEGAVFMDSNTGPVENDANTAVELESTPDTEALTTADGELAQASDDVTASEAGTGLENDEQGSGRLSVLVPTLGHFATRAHKASQPYLSYAAMASQEAARCMRSSSGTWHNLFSTFTPLEVPPLPLTLLQSSRFTAGHAKRYVDKMRSQHRRGEAPPGQVDNAKVDWSGVGAR
ncbi:unnamed protein product [Ectocarpus sp. CCAP 1310/34]|nr:unnamed protein product [Ectocarpus sp. CCAP 1310/34]